MIQHARTTSKVVENHYVWRGLMRHNISRSHQGLWFESTQLLQAFDLLQSIHSH